MGKLRPSRKCASTIADKKPQGKVAHVPGVSLGRTHSNPINIMKNAERLQPRLWNNRRHAHVCPALSSVITVSRPGCRRRTWVDSGPKAFNGLMLRDAADGRSSGLAFS